MKKLYALLASLLLTAGVAAQNPTAYFMEGSTFRSQLNPAFAPLRGYVNIPGLGGIQANISGNLSVGQVFYPRGGSLVTLLDGAVSPSDALRNLNPNNILGEEVRVNLIGFGAFTKNHKNFWSFDLNVRVSNEMQLPYSLFEFFKLGESRNIQHIENSASSHLEAAFNYSFPLLDDKLYIGVRAKFLVGIARARLYYNSFNASLEEDLWRVNTAGGLDITASGTKITTSPDANGNPVYKIDGIDPFNQIKPSGYGFGVDLGATYDILPNLQASLAVTDLGFISWSRAQTHSGISTKEISFSGVDLSDTKATTPEFDLNVLEFHPTQPQGSTRMLRASINAGAEYQLWNHKVGLGLLYTAQFWQYKTFHNLTGSINYHPIRWFTMTGSYSVVGHRGGMVGLALNLNPNWINFYIATDMVVGKHASYFIPIHQSMMNVTLGLGIPIGKRSHRIAAYIYPGDK